MTFGNAFDIPYLRSLPLPEKEAILNSLTGEELEVLAYSFYDFWAHPFQLSPPGDWNTWVILGGRGSGKTRAGAEWIKQREKDGARHIALVGRTSADVRDVMLIGPSGLLSPVLYPEAERPTYNPSLRRVTWPSGAVATLFSADKPEQLRGPQYDTVWADELAAWRRPETWDQVQFGLRLPGRVKPQAIVTTTPQRVEVLRKLLKQPTTVVTGGSTYDNRANLSGNFLDSVTAQYAGTRLGQQELYGLLLDDNPDALWTWETVDRHRRGRPDLILPGHPLWDPDDAVRIVVGVDPEATSTEESAETGIIVAARGRDRQLYVLDDRTVRGTPAVWGAAVVEAYHDWHGDLVVGEVNNGGEMVGFVVETVDRTVPFKAVRATRGKALRAEPISSLYEKGWGHHVGYFSELENQMTAWMPGERSPDRLDALVWAATELMLGITTHPNTSAVGPTRLLPRATVIQPGQALLPSPKPPLWTPKPGGRRWTP